MGIEIERRFLVINDDWKHGATGTLYRQGYLYFREDGVVRLRIAGDQAFLTVKALKDDLSALEYEYEIPVYDGHEMLTELCDGPLVEKIRYRILHGGMIWEIDVFLGDNEGLVIAEVELGSTEQSISLPPWVGDEITGDRRYLNASLYKNPYRNWRID
ncbi:MAG TPA: CYTH domain-containing protein [Deltaproteobacteria bacterium]|nr:CYTH domain-containing protein [Deltaproteobacteria bacterium]